MAGGRGEAGAHVLSWRPVFVYSGPAQPTQRCTGLTRAAKPAAARAWQPATAAGFPQLQRSELASEASLQQAATPFCATKQNICTLEGLEEFGYGHLDRGHRWALRHVRRQKRRLEIREELQRDRTRVSLQPQ